MSSTIAAPTRPQRIGWTRLLGAGALAAVAAAIANVVVYYLASALGAMPDSVLNPQTGLPIGVTEVVTSTVVGAVGATIAFAIINLFARRPARVFTIVAAIVFLLSFATPFGIPGVTVSMTLALYVMHAVAAAIIVWVLTRAARS